MIFDIENSTAGIKSRLLLTQFACEISIYNHLNICIHSVLFVAFYCYSINFTKEALNFYEHCRMIRLL